MRNWILFISVILWLCVACGAKAEYDIRGTWEYTMFSEDGNTYDAGTITFTGKVTKGTYLQFNIYEIEYEGEYTINDTTIKLNGDELWEGMLTSATQMSGTWEHKDEASGTWSATKQNP